MISFEEALKIVMQAAVKKAIEKVDFHNALGRVLAEDVRSDVDMPAHHLSAMDGFACRKADTTGLMNCIEIIPAGKMPVNNIGKGECARIMTGAVVPEGADTVVMFEHVQEDQGVVKVIQKIGGDNIRRRAEDMRRGEIVLRAGKCLKPVDIAVLASVGCIPVPVYRNPRVGVIATGDELVEPVENPGPAQLRNSNSPQLCSQVAQTGCEARYFGIASDTMESLENAVQAAFEACDVVLFSGGVSVGDFDFVPEVLKRRQVNLRFQKVAVKPGKPTVFGTKKTKYFFGLPGNPVSTFVLFEVLVRPFLYKLMGHDFRPVTMRLKLEEAIHRKKSDRREFRPVQLTDNCGVRGFDYHGSAHIHAYTRAGGILSLPVGVNSLEAGETVEVILF